MRFVDELRRAEVDGAALVKRVEMFDELVSALRIIVNTTDYWSADEPWQTREAVRALLVRATGKA